MCGFAGCVTFAGGAEGADLAGTVRRMVDTLSHRGPDDSGVWLDRAAGLAMGHRRLAIIDLSAEGHQPMTSASERFVIVYNGEIYNFRTLRHELQAVGERFRGHSDTEVLLAAMDRWGLEATLPRLVGMFAFALWDRTSRTLHLVRDRLGKKPLYFGWAGRSFLFGSELKALSEHPSFSAEVDRGALTMYTRYSCVPGARSIYSNIYKLTAGGCVSLRWTEHGWREGRDVLAWVRPYWRLRAVAEEGLRRPLGLSEGEAIEQLDDLLSQAVAERLIADVPLGAFLSGGVDSSAVVALMQKQSAQPIQTFTMAFRDAGYDEAADARRVARHLGTDHTELDVSPHEAMEVIPRLAQVYDEPFADESQIPTLLVASLARRKVTVALSGDGGDEAFGGYTRHFLGPRLWRRLRYVPSGVRAYVAATLQAVSPQRWDRLFALPTRVLPRSLRLPAAGDQLHKFARVLTVDSPEAMYLQLISRCDDPQRLVIGGTEPLAPLSSWREDAASMNLPEVMMCYDGERYLPDDVMVKVDRATMAASLEARAPLLDHRVVEFAWRLPLHMKVRNGQGKWILRQVLRRYVPAALTDRPKHGFRVPIGGWLRGPLRDWAESLLDEDRLEQDGFFDGARVRHLWSEHLAGRRDRSCCIWNILMFQAWHEHWCRGQARASRIVARTEPLHRALG